MSTSEPESPPRSESLRASTHLRAIGTALFVTMLWSSSWILIRVGLDDEDLAPLTFAGLRYSLAALTLWAWMASRPARRRQLGVLDRQMLRRLAVLGVVFVAITQGAQFVAIDNQPAATTSLMLAPTALFVGLLSARSLGEGASRRQVAGAALVIVGAVAYFAGDLGATAIGMIAAGIGLAANVTSSLMGRAINRRDDITPALVTTVSMSVGAVLLLGAGLAVEGIPTLTPKLVAIITWLAVVNTAFAFTLWNRSQRRLAAVESAAINNTMLIQIAALAWIFLDEAPGPAGVVGIVVVSAGAYLTTSAPLATRRR
ncbi:MAG: DMT family transporter [Ilumatobacteraceae bacterium]